MSDEGRLLIAGDGVIMTIDQEAVGESWPPYRVVRVGWRWIVVEDCEDGSTRDTHAIRSLYWATAARVAQALMLARKAGREAQT